MAYYDNLTAHRQTSSDGSILWTRSGWLHRHDGPAIEWANGQKEWYLDGKRHRTDGPALKYANGDKEWWVNGEEISPPYSYVLTAALNRGMPIPEEAMLEIAGATTELLTKNEQIGRLKTILHKYWPTDVQKILAPLFMDTDPAIKHLAFSLLARQVPPDSMSSVLL